MISRLFLTLILASSLSLTAAQEVKPANTAKQQKKSAKDFSKVALAASVLTTSFGLYNGHPGLTGYGIGLLTGFGCAHYESNPDSYPFIVSWIAETLARAGIISVTFSGLDQNARLCVLRGSSLGSWTAYLGYRIANTMDKE